MNNFEDKTRRDALARSLCARISDERRGVDVLYALDKLLARLDDPLPGVLELLVTDRYNEDEGDELERAKRRGWNAGMAHATALVRADRGLRELAHAPVIQTIDQPLLDLRLKNALTEGE